MIANVFDNPDEEGIDLEFDFENGMALTVYMGDKDAQNLVKIIQNKLNARLP